MDLSLRGSQINLAVRHKPKPPIIKYPLQRPRSENINKLGCNSPLYRRPFSVDLKLGFRHFIGLPENIYEEEDCQENNQESLSTSSSNLLKFLLNEPIRRSWVCPDCDNISLSSMGDLKSEEDTKSGFLLKETRKNAHYSKEYSSGVDSKSTNQSLSRDRSSKNSENSKMSTKNNSEVTGSSSTPSRDHHNFWLNSKLDLPGKVSFGRSNVYDADILSDCENEEGLLVPNNSLMSSKKSVHFEEHNETKNGEYDYSKCSTNNCSCKPRASPEPENYPLRNEKPKCLCEFSCNSSDFTNLSIPVKPIEQNQGLKNGFTQPEAKKDEINVIRQYGDVVSNGNVHSRNENIENNKRTFQIETQGKLNDVDKLKNTNCFNNDLSEGDKIIGKDLKNNYSKLDSFKQNDFSDISNFSNPHNATTDTGSVENTSRANTLSTSESPNPVIRSYLETVRASSGKKQNNTSHYKRSKKVLKIRRSKSASAGSDELKRHKVNLKNARTFCCLREDTNLDEFHLDKVDSWMSLHKPSSRHGQNFHTPKYVKRYSPEDYEENDITASPQHSKSDSQDSSTYEEIVSVIREIEEDKKQEKPSESEECMDLKLQTILQSESSNTTNSSTHQDKLKDILSYLDDVENSCEKTLMETRRSLPDESNKPEIDFDVEDVAEDVPKFPELLLLPNHQLAKRVVTLSLRANELTNAIQLSKDTVTRIRLEKQRALRVEKQSATNRIREQKKHYEGVVARHQGFIEQLLKDKALLCEKVAAVTRRLDSQNQAWEHKLETELARAKETALAGEKIRKERWVRENTKKIKELTVKGLEAEINKMNSNHQQEILELKRQHQQELLDSLEEARLKHEEIEQSMRESLCKDREAAIEKERLAMRERVDRQMQVEQNVFDEQKAKLLEEVALERERLQIQLRQKENEFQIKVEEILREKEIILFRSQAEYREKLEQQEQKYQNRINSIEKQFESDFLVWKKEFENACRLREVEKENTLRQHYRAERDHQIDAIVSKMDAESLKSQEEFENKLSRMKEKYENDIREAEALEKSLREKYTETRNKLAESDAEAQNLRVEIKQLQLGMNHSKKMYEEILAEKEQIKSNFREEVQREITTITAERDSEIQKIYTRVQQAIEKKDATLDFLKKENANLRERCLKLEAVIRQQRKDYCIK